MINPEDYRAHRATTETADGGDVDVDAAEFAHIFAEVVLGLDGRRITEADTQAFTTARGGRLSLTGAGPLTAGVVPGARADPAAMVQECHS